MRYLANVLLASALAVAAFVGLFMLLTASSKSAEPIQLAPKPPEVRGWVLLHICVASKERQKDFPDWFYIVPTAILGIGDPDDAPDGCVRISFVNNMRMYVYGSNHEVAKTISDAVWGPSNGG